MLLAISAFATSNITFEPNLGQMDSRSRFISRVNGAIVRFSSEAIEFSQHSEESLTLRFVNGNRAAEWRGEDALESSTSYFLGADPVKWIRNVPHWRRVVRRNVYPGIDVVFYGDQGQVEFDFVAAPGADLRRIRLRWQGPGVSQGVSATGDLHIRAPGHPDLVCRKPRIYQLSNGERVPIEGRYVPSTNANEVRFALGPYNRALPITIDPVIDALTFFGAEGTDRIVGRAGSIVVGSTNSVNLLRSQFPPGRHIFVQSGSSYAIYGGSGEEEPTAVAFNGFPTMIVGWTTSKDFPTSRDAPQRTFGGGAVDGFYFVYGPSDPTISYLGGSGDDRILAVSRDSDSPSSFNLSGYYLAGETSSPDFPVLNAYQPKLAGGQDGFLAHVVANVLTSSTYWGGTGDDAILAVDANSTACWFGGRTTSPDLPVQGGPQNQLAGASDGFLVRLNTGVTSSTLDFATYFGGTGDDELRALRLGPDGWIWMGGVTTSADFPVTAAMQRALAGDTDAWVARIHPRGTEVAFATYLGGSGHDELTALTHDPNGDLYVAGFTNSTDLPLRDPLQDHPGGGDDGFLARFDSTGASAMVTYFGGPGNDRFRSIGSLGDARIQASGESDSPAIAAGVAPVTAPAGGMDGFELTFHQDGIFVRDLILGNGLTSNLEVMVRGGFAGEVTVRSTDPSKVTVNSGAVSTNSFRLDGFASEGKVELIVSAPSLPPRRVTVTLAPGRLINSYVDELRCPMNTLTNLNFRIGVERPETGEVVLQKPSSTNTSVWLQSSDPLIIQPKVYSNNNESTNVTGALRATAEGSAIVTIRSPKFPVLGPETFSARGVLATTTIQVSDVAVGQLLQTRVLLSLASSNGQSTAFGVHVSSEDPSIAVVSNSAAFRGGSATNYSFNPASGVTNYVWIQGRSRGQTRLRFEVDGADPVYANVVVLPSVVVLSSTRFDFSPQPGVLTPQLTIAKTVTVESTSFYGLICVIDGTVPLGYTVREQIPSPESENIFTVESTSEDSGRTVGIAAFNLARPDFFLFYGVTFSRPGTFRVVAKCPGLNSGPALEVTVKDKVLPLMISEFTLGKDLTYQVPFGAPGDFPRDVQVTITSSDPSRLVLGRNLPEEGGKIQATPVPSGFGEGFYITALAATGDVTVTLTAPNFPSRTLLVHLAQTRFRLSPSTLTVQRGGGGSAQVAWTYPGMPEVPVPLVRPAANLSFRVDVANRQVAVVDPPAFTIQGYFRYIGPTTLNVGSTTLTLVSTSSALVDPQFATLTVNVVPTKSTFAQETMLLGKDLQRSLPDFAYTGLVTPAGITLRSEDPSRVLLSHSRTAEGSATLDATQPVYVQGLADSGDVNIVASLPGYSDAVLKVRLLPSAIGFDRAGSGYAQKVMSGETVQLQANLFAIDPASGNPIFLSSTTIRGGLDPFEVRLKNSNPVAGTAASTIVFGPGEFSGSTKFRADALGATDITVEPARGFADGGASLTRRIEVVQPALFLTDRSLGKNLQATVSLGFSSAPPTLTSSDPSRLVLSTSPTVLGTQSVTLGASRTVYMQALEDSGEVTLTATAPGYDSATAKVYLQPSYFAFRSSPNDFGLPIAFRLVTNAISQSAVYLTYPGGELFNSGSESIRPGLGSVVVPISISNSGVAELSVPVEFTAGSPSPQMLLVGKDAGTAQVTIGDIAGFAAAPASERVANVEVTPHRISLSDSRVGQDRSVDLSYSTNEEVAAPTTLRITSNDPARVLLSTDVNSPGSAEVAINVAPRTNRPQLFVSGLASSGSATITATAAGFQTQSATVTLLPSGFAFNISFTDISGRVGTPINVGISATDGRIRAGVAPITVAIANSNPQVAQIAPVVFKPGDTTQNLAITPLSRGSTILTIRDHPQGVSYVLVVNVQ